MNIVREVQKDLASISSHINKLRKRVETIPTFKLGTANTVDLLNNRVLVEMNTVDANGVSTTTMVPMEFIGNPPAVLDTVQVIDLGRGQQVVMGTKAQSATPSAQVALGIPPNGFIKTTANSPVFTNTFGGIDWPALTISPILSASRTYEIAAGCNTILGAGMTATSEAMLIIQDITVPASTVTVAYTRGQANAANQNAHGLFVVGHIVNPLPGLKQYRVRGWCLVSGTFQANADATSPAFLRIQDIGPA